MELPELTHAELLRRIQLEIDQIGSQAAAARVWGVSKQLLGKIIKQERNIGPKLLKALKMKRVTLVVHRYAPWTSGKRIRTPRKPSRPGRQFRTERVGPPK